MILLTSKIVIDVSTKYTHLDAIVGVVSSMWQHVLISRYETCVVTKLCASAFRQTMLRLSLVLLRLHVAIGLVAQIFPAPSCASMLRRSSSFFMRDAGVPATLEFSAFKGYFIVADGSTKQVEIPKDRVGKGCLQGARVIYNDNAAADETCHPYYDGNRRCGMCCCDDATAHGYAQ